MSRLASAVRWDVRTQWRQGLYYAALFVALLWTALLFGTPPAARELFVPFVVFFDLSVFGFFFMAGILYLEKGEGVLQALVTSPLRRGEYLAAKVATLSLLAVLTSILMVLLLYGWQVNWLMLALGVGLNSWLLVLIGFILAVRYDGIGEFLMPSALYTIPTQIPLLGYFDVWHSPLIYLVPTQPAMLLIEAAFRPIAAWELVYALAYLALALALVSWWARRAFDRFVVKTRGER